MRFLKLVFGRTYCFKITSQGVESEATIQAFSLNSAVSALHREINSSSLRIERVIIVSAHKITIIKF